MKKALIIAGVLLMAFAACKKSKPADDTGTGNTDTGSNDVPATGSTLDKIKDSVFLYAKEDYYWYTALPSYSTFNPRSFTGADDLTALQNEVDKLSQYSLNPNNNNLPYEYYTPAPGEAKYSFIDEGQASQRLSAVSGDFGFAPIFYTSSTLYVKYVYPGSPADLAGIKRGYQILSINGRSGLTNSSTNAQFIYNAYAQSSTITMTLAKYDNTTFSVSLNTSNYKINPVITYETLPQPNGKIIGYMVFNSFVQLSSAQAAIDAAFNSFVKAGVTDLVVDLRYDGGGYVETAEYLDNWIAPSSANGKLMYSTYYNDILTAGKETLLKNQVRRDDKTGQLFNYSQIDYSAANNKTYFAKNGALSATRVFFIVTSGTASASELTINNLRPYMPVQLVGTTTYGKPVGFFDIDINKYEMYIPEFETKNASGQGGYYTGMVPATTDYPGFKAIDDPKHAFGDVNEGLLAQVINYVNKGVYITSSSLAIQSTEGSSGSTVLTEDQQRDVNARLNPNQFNGMVRSHYVLKK